MSRDLLHILLIFGIPITSFISAVFMEEGQYGWALLFGLGTLIFTGTEIARFVRKKSMELEKDGKTLKQSCLYRFINQETCSSVQKRLVQLRKKLKLSGVHITAHLAIKRGDCKGCQLDYSLLQLGNYIGEMPRGERRVFPAYKGIIGRCFRTGRPQAFNFTDEIEYYNRMTLEFGYLHDEAKYHVEHACSYLCEPIGESGKVIGVLYLYAKEPRTFPDDPTQFGQREELINACGYIATMLANDTKARQAQSE